MESWPEPTVTLSRGTSGRATAMQNRARLLVTGVSLYALVGGIASLTGWAADIPWLADWDHDGIAIQPNAALAEICASLGPLARPRGRTRGHRDPAEGGPGGVLCQPRTHCADERPHASGGRTRGPGVADRRNRALS